MVKIQRLRCLDCSYEPPSTIRTMFGGNLSGDLMRLQSELGAEHTFRDSEEILKMFSTKYRAINNHNRIKEITHTMGDTVQKVVQAESKLLTVEEAAELIVNIDGGHVKTVEDQRSIEALAAVVYRPESLVLDGGSSINRIDRIESKSCSASAMDDGQKEMISNTIVAVLKQGMTPNTNITALSDGAENCWNVIDALRPLCASVTCILDWFHITMKMKNIALPESLTIKFLRIQWHLWRGKTEAAIKRLQQLITETTTDNVVDKLVKFTKYIQNNIHRIVDYRSRKRKGLVFTSNLAESTVENLINQRCKGQQHMRWSRDGLNPVLQLRAAINSNDWDCRWRTVILNSLK